MSKSAALSSLKSYVGLSFHISKLTFLTDFLYMWSNKGYLALHFVLFKLGVKLVLWYQKIEKPITGVTIFSLIPLTDNASHSIVQFLSTNAQKPNRKTISNPYKTSPPDISFSADQSWRGIRFMGPFKMILLYLMCVGIKLEISSGFLDWLKHKSQEK